MADKRVVLNKDQFYQRAERLYEEWEKGDYGLDGVNSMAVVYGNSDYPYTKSSSLHSWLLGHEVIDTAILFLKDHIYVLGSNRKAEYFSPVVGTEFHGKVPPVSTIHRDKSDKDAANFEKLIGYITSAGGPVGTFVKEKFDSEFVSAWNKALAENDVQKTDVTLAFVHLFAVKDEKEIEWVRKSAQVTTTTWTAARGKYVEVIDQERRVRHSVLSSDFAGFMKDAKIQQSLAKYNIDTCYDPIVMSGGNYSFKWNHESSEAHLHTQFGTIITSFGARLEDYCSNVTRTMLIFPSSELETAYESILATEQAIIGALKPGAKLSDVYKIGVDTLTERSPKLAENLNKKELGFATGIEFRESRISISAKCEEVVKPGMVFIVYVGVDGISNKNKGEKGKPVAIAISDTVLIKAEGDNEVLTEKAKSRLKSNVIKFKDEGQENDKAEKEADQKKMLGRGQRSVVLNDQTRNKTTNEEMRKERQKELGRQLNDVARARLSRQDGSTDEKKVKKSNVSYKNAEKFPTEGEVQKMLIHVDRKYDSVIVPIFGVPVPFHISMIKNCSQSVEGDFTYLRINFATPGSQVGKDNAQFPHPLAHFVKELTFRASNLKEHHSDSSPPSGNLTTAFRLIKEMQKRFRTEEAEEREKEGAVKQDKLILSQNKLNPKLKDLLIRPNIIQKRITGSLEAHTNGFRYTSLRGDRIDVLYNNIKHAFFQPCDNEMIILLHFHLKNPVMWGKKKYKDVQFYTEVGEITTDLGKYHHMQDRDDMQSEQQEREMRRRLNAAFNGFCEKVSRLTNDQFEFDSPFAGLGFFGVPFRSATTLKPTASCLVNLTEWPPFIVTLSEVELVHFERVSLQLKNFDMVFIFKDYKQKPQMVAQIPMSSIDKIKEWLHTCDIWYSEGIQSLNWAKVMKTITDDLEAFFDNGGWSFLDTESDNEDANDDSDESDAYDPEEEDASGGGSESESDEDESEGEETDDSDDDGEGSLDSDESEGKDWSDLEEEAANADRRREVEDRDGGGSSGRDRDRKRPHSSKGGPSHKRRK